MVNDPNKIFWIRLHFVLSQLHQQSDRNFASVEKAACKFSAATPIRSIQNFSPASQRL